MSPQNVRFAGMVRALRGTSQEAAAKELLHALRKEREFRKRIERLRRNQSAHLFQAAGELSGLKHEVRR